MPVQIKLWTGYQKVAEKAKFMVAIQPRCYKQSKEILAVVERIRTVK